MGVYLNTFRTSHKVATHNGQSIKVYAYRYLCKAGDDEMWSPLRRRHLLRASISRSAMLFEEHEPQFAAGVHDQNWNNVIVMSGLHGACHYDTVSFGTDVVGFLVKQGRKWVVAAERQTEDRPYALGLPITRRSTERVVNGKIVATVNSYTFSNGVEMTDDQFKAWKEKNEPEYVAKCLEAQAEMTRRNEEAAAARQVKIDSKDAEINDVQQRLNQLKQERAAI